MQAGASLLERLPLDQSFVLFHRQADAANPQSIGLSIPGVGEGMEPDDQDVFPLIWVIEGSTGT